LKSFKQPMLLQNCLFASLESRESKKIGEWLRCLHVHIDYWTFTAFETMLMRVWNCLRRKMTSCFSQGTNSVLIALLCVALITYTLSVVSSSPANEETGARIPPE
jgi:hypothetical protein